MIKGVVALINSAQLEIRKPHKPPNYFCIFQAEIFAVKMAAELMQLLGFKGKQYTTMWRAKRQLWP